MSEDTDPHPWERQLERTGRMFKYASELKRADETDEKLEDDPKPAEGTE